MLYISGMLFEILVGGVEEVAVCTVDIAAFGDFEDHLDS